MPVCLHPSDLDFSQGLPVISEALKFVLPVPTDRGEPLVYPEAATDASGRVHPRGELLTGEDGRPLGKSGVVVWNASERIYQGAVCDGEGDARAVIIVNNVSEETGTLLHDKWRMIAGAQPDLLTLAQFIALEHYARSLGLGTMYPSTIAYVRQHLQDADARATAAASLYGLKKRRATDRVLALRVPLAGELMRPGQPPLPFATGGILLKHGNDVRVITARDLEATYRKADDFSRLEASRIPLLGLPTPPRPGCLRRVLRSFTASRR